jgi:hypothetical protein
LVKQTKSQKNVPWATFRNRFNGIVDQGAKKKSEEIMLHKEVKRGWDGMQSSESLQHRMENKLYLQANPVKAWRFQTAAREQRFQQRE